MKRIAFLSMFLALGLFASGCGDTATKKDTTKTTTTQSTDKDTGEKKIETEHETSSTDSDTGAKEETSIEEEHTTKPPQDGNDDLDNATTDPVDDATRADDKTNDAE